MKPTRCGSDLVGKIGSRAAWYGLMAASLLSGPTALTAGAAPADPYSGYVSAIYSDSANWLCRPDTDDPCDHDLDATAVLASGDIEVEEWEPATDPPIDCFYLYPTISTDRTGNSDFVAGENDEIFVVRQQTARLGAACRVFAPIYRQVTLTALLGILTGNPIDADSALADADVLDAWKHYIANDNGGRGFVLIGHSQGAGRLITLIRNEIDQTPDLRGRLVSAMLLGTSFQVPEDTDVGGDFANIPLCHSGQDVGCVVTYSSFRATSPPPENSYFGRSNQPGWKAACTNPAFLANNTNELHPYFPTNGRSLPVLGVPPSVPWVDPSLGVSITTPFVTLPEFVEAACAEENGFSYLAITVNADPADPRIDDIGGDLTPEWGLHLVDANVAMGDLVTIAEIQGQAYQAANASATDDDDTGCAINPHFNPGATIALLLGALSLAWRRSR